jgi:hypothetical protein
LRHAGGQPPIAAEMISDLRKFSFSSVRTIADFLNIPISMMDTHLVEKGVLTSFCWVP